MILHRHQLRPFARVITALAGILLMLAGEAPLVAFAGQAAAMDCCKDGQCCRRKHHQTRQSGPGWQGDVCGVPGCGGSLGTSSVPMHAGVAQTVQLHLTPMQVLLVLFCLSIAAVQFAPERFQRPPPSLL